MPLPKGDSAPVPAARSQRIAFDKFEVDLRTGELFKSGVRVRLQAQPFQLLVLLLENAGEVVTRDVICHELWPGNTFVDFEHGLAAAVSKVREALGDSVLNAKYIETLPKRGYRFVGDVKLQPPPITTLPAPDEAPGIAVVTKQNPRIWNWRTLAACAAVLILAVAAFLLVRSRQHLSDAVEGFNAAPLITYPGIAQAPSISPDGTRVAFSWDNDSINRTGQSRYDLYTKAIGSETLVRLTNHTADWISSAWSPDGTQIAFHRLAAGDNGIYVVPALGGPERKLLSTQTPYDLAAPINWSPDGKWIAFADRKEGVSGDRIYLLNVETLEVRPFPIHPACIHEGLLSYSHSGKQVAFVCVHNLNSI